MWRDGTDHTATMESIKSIDAIAATEFIAHDFLARGGKRARPFITLAAHDAMIGGEGTSPDSSDAIASIPKSVKRAALSIETFHKASLVHDDIQDEDAFRYGQLSAHHRFGVASAINIGDYLIGLGYRLLRNRSVPLERSARHGNPDRRRPP